MELIYLLSMEDPDRQTSVLTSYYKFKQGGLCTRLLRTMHALLDFGYKVHYLSVEPFPISHPNCIHHKLFWPSKNNDSFLFWCYFALVAPFYIFVICRKHKITNLFVFDIFYAFSMQLSRLVFKLPLSVFLRADSIKNQEIKGVAKPILKLEIIFEKVSLFGSKIICVSKGLREDVYKRHPRFSSNKIKLLLNDIRPVENKYVFKRKEIIRISSVGVYEKRKNQTFLIDVMSKISNHNWKLSLFGEGDMRDEIQNRVLDKSLDDQIKLNGWVEKEYIWENTDLLLMPSIHEGAPNAVLEALASNIAVIASDIPEHREILPIENLIHLENEARWVNRINKIVSSSEVEIKKIYSKQVDYAKKLEFDWDSQICNIIISR